MKEDSEEKVVFISTEHLWVEIMKLNHMGLSQKLISNNLCRYM